MFHVRLLAALLPVLVASAARASLADARVPWRPFSAAAFEEARESHRPVFLVLTAPWTWDHFLLGERLFADPDVRARLAADWIPVLADAEVHPELRGLWSIPSGLLPSFHFLDADGVAFASSAPLPADVLVFRLDQWRDAAARPPAVPPAPPASMEILDGSFPERAALRLIELSERGDLAVAPAHRDLDPAPLVFLAEIADPSLLLKTAQTLARELFPLRAGALADAVDGGCHRAYAVPDSVAHFEKTLDVNLAMGRLLTLQFVRTRSMELGAEALGVLRFLNEKLRAGRDPVYAASLAADVYDHTGRELEETGAEHYAKRDAGARGASAPPVSSTLPAGGNFEAMDVFFTYASVFGDDRIVSAVARAGPRLLEEGLDGDGRARRVLGVPGAGSLRDQARAGRGLLAIHALTGSPDALRAAARLADRMVAAYGTGTKGVFRTVATDADVPRSVHELPPDPGANGEALRFLVELGAVTRDRERLETARDGLAAWRKMAPVDGRGLGELGGAALHLQTPPAVFLVRAEAGSEEGRRLVAAALSVHSPALRLRWVARDEAKEVARRFGVRFEAEPALYLVRGRPSGALRDPDVVLAVWREASHDSSR